MAKKLYVGNLSYSTSEDKLRSLFAEVGEVTDVFLPTDRETGRMRGFGFVEMANDESGRAAIEGTNGVAFHGRDLVVNEARPRTEGAGGGFRGGNGGGYRGGDRGDRGGYRGGDRGDRGGYRRDEY